MIDPAMAMLGLGAAGDVFGAFSAYSQQKRQRDLYNQMMAYNNPANVLARQQQFYQGNVANLQQQMPNILRETVNPMIGMRGIDPGSGQGQLIYNQAIAPHLMNAWSQAGTQAQGGLNALNQAGQNIGTPYGTSGGTGNALQAMMLMQALRGGRQPQGGAVANYPGTNTTQVPGSPMQVPGQDVSNFDFLESQYVPTF